MLLVVVRKARQVSVPAEAYVFATHEMRSRLCANAADAVVRVKIRIFTDDAIRNLRFEKIRLESITSSPFVRARRSPVCVPSSTRAQNEAPCCCCGEPGLTRHTGSAVANSPQQQELVRLG